MFELEDTYWWFVGRRHLVRRLIGQLPLGPHPRILDAGCGTGAGLDNLERFGAPCGIDSSADALEFCRVRGKGRLVRTTLGKPGLRDGGFDLITMLDVLEHVDDDARVLASLFRLLRPGGSLILTVPAYPFLWSEHDVALHHKRRYVGRELRAKVLDAGFEIRRMSGLVSSFLPAVLLFRLAQKLFPHRRGPRTSFVVLPSFLNELLAAVLMAEVEVSRRVAIPFGVTLYVLAQKPSVVTVPVVSRALPALPIAVS